MTNRLQIRWVTTNDEFHNHQTIKAVILNRFDGPVSIAMLRIFESGNKLAWYPNIGKYLLCKSSTTKNESEWNDTIESFKEKIEKEWNELLNN